jgi:hypothetical protein
MTKPRMSAPDPIISINECTASAFSPRLPVTKDMVSFIATSMAFSRREYAATLIRILSSFVSPVVIMAFLLLAIGFRVYLTVGAHPIRQLYGLPSPIG